MTAADRGATLDEREVVDAVLGGDREAFRRLVERESRSVIATCTRILGDRSEAEDVAQEAFVTAYRSLAIVAGRRLVRRLALADRRAARDPARGPAQAGRLARPDRRHRSGGATVRARPRARAPGDPATAVLRSERDAQLRAAVAALESRTARSSRSASSRSGRSPRSPRPRTARSGPSRPTSIAASPGCAGAIEETER